MKKKNLFLFIAFVVAFVGIEIVNSLPAENAVVQIMWSDGSRQYTNYTLTNSAGYYEIRVAEGDVNLSVHLENISGNRQVVVYDYANFSISGSKWQNFTLFSFPDDNVKLYGYIYDNETDEPIKNATIMVYFENDKWYGSNYTTTNESGYYEINLLGGKIEVEIFAKHYYYKFDQFLLITDTEKIYYLDAYPEETAILKGYVRDFYGIPITNAQIIASNISYAYTNYTFSDLTGYYEMNLIEGNYSIISTANGYLSNQKFIYVDGIQWLNISLDAFPADNALVEGYIYDAQTLQPIPDANVTIYGSIIKFATNEIYFGTFTRYAVTNQYGYYSVMVPAIQQKVFPYQQSNINSVCAVAYHYFDNSTSFGPISGLIEPGDTIRVDLYLEPYPEENCLIRGFVYLGYTNNPPICSLNVMPSEGYAPLQVEFLMYAHDTDGYITSWKLDTNNDGIPEYSGAGEPPSNWHHVYYYPGEYVANLTVFDNLGNSSYSTVTVNVYARNIPPTINITYPAEGETVSGVITITGIAYDEDDGLPTVDLRIDNGSWEEVAIAANPDYLSWSYVWDTRSVENGLHTIFARAYDGENYSIATVNVTVYNLPLPSIVYVDDDYNNETEGWQYDHFDNIQDALNMVKKNGIIYVYDGMYSNLTVNKTVNLIGYGAILKDLTFVSSANIFNFTVYNTEIKHENVTIEDCTLINVSIDSGFVKIMESLFINGTTIGYNQTNILIQNSSFYEYEINFSKINHSVIKNCYYENSSFHIYNSSFNYIINCSTLNSSILMKCSESIAIERCKCSHNMKAIYLYYCTNITINDCNLSSNNIGIYLYLSNKNVIRNCYIHSNNFGIFLNQSFNNRIYYNSFISNIIQAYDTDSNKWDNGYPYGGNYWDDFDSPEEGAYDNNSDGIVDKPYHINENAIDNYPLISPYSPFIIYNLTIIVSPEEGGSVILQPSGGLYREGTIVNITAVPNFGYIFDHWSGDITGNKTSLEIVMDGNKFITAYFITNSPPDTILIQYPSSSLINYSNVTFKWSGSDDLTPEELTYSYKLEGYEIEWSDWTKSTTVTYNNLRDGTYTFKVRAKDAYGMVDPTPAIFHFTVDTTPPYTSSNINAQSGNNGWYVSNVTVNLSSNDVNGVNATYYRINNGNWKEYENEIVLTNEGEYILEYYSIDDAGNKEKVKNITIKIDKTKPSTSHTIEPSSPNGKNGWYISNVTISLSANDAISGINKILYRINNGSWNEYSQQIKITEGGEYVIEYYSIDNAGNEESVKKINVKLDKDTPSLSVDKPMERYLYIFDRKVMPLLLRTVIIGKITIETTVNDAISGIKEVRFYFDDELVYNDTEYPYKWVLNEMALIRHRHTIKIEAIDNAGNSIYKEIKIWIYNI